jgi:catalase
MHGYGGHTFSWRNGRGELHWVKYHFHTEQGIENLTDDEARDVAGPAPDFHRADLWSAIDAGQHPSWTLYVQVMPTTDAESYRFNPFDLTKVWSQQDYPLMKVGRMVLDRNPTNFFAEIEQAAFEPSNFVPGIGPSPDRMLLGRLFSYPDTHRHRIGANYQQLPVNRPLTGVHTYSVDGPMTYHHASNQPVYAPNSRGGPAADAVVAAEVTWPVPVADMVRAATDLHAADDDFGQAGDLYRQVLSDMDRDHLVSNISGHLSLVSDDAVRRRALVYWDNVDAELGQRVKTVVDR